MTRFLRWTQYLCMASLGLAMNVIPPLVPVIKAEIPMSYLEAGMVFSGQFLGMLLSVPFAGHLADRMGKKPFLVASGVLSVLGLAGFGLAHGVPSLLATSIVAGVGSGGFEVGSNALQADHTADEAGTSMNLLHLFYGAAAVAAPALCTVVQRSGLDWRVAPVAAALAPALVVAALLAQHVGRGVHAPAEDAGTVYRSGLLWLCSAAVTVYVGIEVSVMGWGALYWSQRAADSVVPASLIPSIFWAAVTVGRLLCGPVADRVGLLRYVTGASAAVLALAGAWALWPVPAVTLAAVLLLGLSLAGIFPTTMAHATSAFPGHSGKVVALLAVFASLGGFAIPSGIGKLADARSVGVVPGIIAGLALVMVLLVRAIPARAAARREAGR